GLPGGPEHVCDRDAENRRGRLDERIPERDSVATARAPPAQGEPAQHGHVVNRGYALAAARARGRRPREAEATVVSGRRYRDGLRGELGAVGGPRELHHDRQPIRYDVEEAADD